MKEVFDFLAGSRRNAWLECADKRVYVRVAVHFHPELKRVLTCFDIANITVNSPGNKVFSTWFDELQTVLVSAPVVKDYEFDAIYIESVLNARFAEHLRGKGMYETPGSNFFLMLPKISI